MRVVLMQFVDPHLNEPPPVFSHSLGVTAALLAERDISCRLVTLPGYRPAALSHAITKLQPDAVLAELNPHSVTAARRTLGDLSEREELPIAVCGVFATCRPRRAMSFPGVRALLLGEYEQSAVELLTAWRDGREPTDNSGMWLNTATGLVKGPVRPLLEDLDSLPHPRRDLFARGGQAPAELQIKTARGCPRWCGHCVNDWYMDLYANGGPFVRRRSVGDVLDELREMVARYDGAERVSFLDHSFAMDAGWLERFVADYPRRCVLPYRCRVDTGGVDERTAGMLRSSLCRWVDVELGAGSRFIREEILSIHTPRQQLVDGCRMLRDAGLHVRAEVFVGAPYETEITIEETLGLLREVDADEVVGRVFYPTPGTRAAEVCEENGWLSGRGEINYWLGRSVLEMPALPAEQIDRIAEKLPSLMRQPRGTVRKMIRRSRRRGRFWRARRRPT